MKHTLLIITALMLVVGCSETVTTVTEVIEYHSSKDWSPKKIRVYDISGDKIVLTYKEIEFYRNGQKKSEGTYKYGGYHTITQSSSGREIYRKRIYLDSELISEKCWDEDGNEIGCG